MIKIDDIITNNRERGYSEIFEEKGQPIPRNMLVPGHYYSFDIEIPNITTNWIPNSKEEYNEEPMKFITPNQYYDLNPVGLALYHDKWQNNLIMINLKVIPPKYHPTIFNAHLNIIEKSLEIIGGLGGKLDPLEERLKQNLPMYGITSSILRQATGINLNSAINAYKLDYVKSAKMLDWNDIGELPTPTIDTKGLLLSSSTYNVNRIFELFDFKQY